MNLWQNIVAKPAYRFIVGFVFLVLAILTVSLGTTGFPRSLDLVTSGGLLLLSALCIFGRRVPFLLFRILLLVGLAAGLCSFDIYEVIEGHKPWWRLVSLPVLVVFLFCLPYKKAAAE